MKHLSFLRLLFLAAILPLLSSCTATNGRPDLVWTPDGHQYGIASFYDDHMDRTANGELFNMHALTAAHPSIALNSLVEVTNLDNGKKIVVRVNDRLPPIHDGRVIDLSVAAFKRLAPLETGLINVELRVVEYGNNKYVLIDKAAPSGKMYLASNSPAPKSKSVAKTSVATAKTSVASAKARISADPTANATKTAKADKML